MSAHRRSDEGDSPRRLRQGRRRSTSQTLWERPHLNTRLSSARARQGSSRT